MHAFDCACRADGHKDGCFYRPVVGLNQAGACLAVAACGLKGKFHFVLAWEGLKQLVGVYACVVKGLEIGYDGGAVFGVCDAEPARGRGENVDTCLAAFDELVDNRGDEELALGLVSVLGQEFAKLAGAIVEVVGCEAPEVHRHGSLGIDVCRIAVGIGIGDVMVGIIAQGGALDHVGEFAVAVDGANATAYRTVLGHGVAELEGYHAVASFRPLGQGCELARHDLECVAAIEVVGIYDREGLVDGPGTHEYGVVGTPRLGAAFGHGEAFGEGVDRLEYDLYGHMTLIFAEDFIAEIGLEIVADNKYDFAKAGLQGVVDAIVHDGLALWPYAVELFEAAVAAAHAGSKNV